MGGSGSRPGSQQPLGPPGTAAQPRCLTPARLPPYLQAALSHQVTRQAAATAHHLSAQPPRWSRGGGGRSGAKANDGFSGRGGWDCGTLACPCAKGPHPAADEAASPSPAAGPGPLAVGHNPRTPQLLFAPQRSPGPPTPLPSQYSPAPTSPLSSNAPQHPPSHSPLPPVPPTPSIAQDPTHPPRRHRNRAIPPGLPEVQPASAPQPMRD